MDTLRISPQHLPSRARLWLLAAVFLVVTACSTTQQGRIPANADENVCARLAGAPEVWRVLEKSARNTRIPQATLFVLSTFAPLQDNALMPLWDRFRYAQKDTTAKQLNWADRVRYSAWYGQLAYDSLGFAPNDIASHLAARATGMSAFHTHKDAWLARNPKTLAAIIAQQIAAEKRLATCPFPGE